MRRHPMPGGRSCELSSVSEAARVAQRGLRGTPEANAHAYRLRYPARTSRLLAFGDSHCRVGSPGMASGRALLLSADIGGYTDYIRSHRMSLGHAEANTARLLERMIDAARDFDLIEIEGDAVFLSRQADALNSEATVAAITQAAVAMHRAFHIERRHIATNLCPCDGCAQADNLKLKFVAHIGEVVSQTIKQRRTLVGIAGIFVHRLLKHHVALPESVLLREAAYLAGSSALPDRVP